MKKALLLVSACLLHLVANAQDYAQNLNSIFPVQNTVTTGYPEFTGANVTQSYEYLGKKIFLASLLYLFKGEDHYYGCGIENINQLHKRDFGSFISFTYFTKKDAESSGSWNCSSATTQFAFHPGGINDGKTADYNNAEEPFYVPLYCFTYSDTEGLNLVDSQSAKVIANIGAGGDIKKYAYLTVIAGDNRNSEDVIVVAGNDGLKVYGVFVSSGESTVRLVSSTNHVTSYFGLNGQKRVSPTHGVNIVSDGDSTKKVFLK